MFNAKVHNEKIYWQYILGTQVLFPYGNLKDWVGRSRKVERSNQQDQLNIFQSSSCKADRE